MPKIHTSEKRPSGCVTTPPIAAHFLIVVPLVGSLLSCAPPQLQPPEQPCRSLRAGDIVVSEFMADPDGTDTGQQYIELYNTTSADIDLEGVSLFRAWADGSRQSSVMLRTAKVAAGSYFVLGDVGPDADSRPAYVDYGYGNALGELRHSDGKLGVRCGTTLIDDVSYTSVEPGHARELDGALLPSSTANDIPQNWCDATSRLDSLDPAGNDFGTPGKPNAVCPAVPTDGCTDSSTGPNNACRSQADAGAPLGQCRDTDSGTMRDPVRPHPGELLITEIMAAPTVGNGGSGEWFEVLAKAPVDLNGLELGNETTATTTLESDTCLHVDGGDWLLFARSVDPAANGGLPAVTATFSFGLADSSSSSYPKRAVALRFAGSELDRASWTSSTKGASLQLAASKLDPSLSQDPASWCTTPDLYTYGAGDRGSPAHDNVSCPIELPDAATEPLDAASSSQCRDAGSGALRDRLEPRAGDLVITEVMAAPTVGNNGPGEWFELFARSSVDLNGLELANEGSGSTKLDSENCLSVNGGDWLLFARSADPLENGGLPPITATFSFTLADASSSTYPTRSVVLRFGAEELGRASWTSSNRGTSRQLSIDVLDLDAGTGSAVWCLTPSDATFGAGDRGTPASSNRRCP